MEKPKPTDIYDVKNYTDKELFALMDLDAPSDRELEAKIIFYITKYENIETESAIELNKFFRDIYNYFFVQDQEQDQDQYQEGFGDYMNPTETIAPNGLKNDPESSVINGDIRLTAPASQPAQPTTDPKQFQGTQSAAAVISPPSAQSTVQLGFTTNLDYRQDQLNPLLKQTIKRIVSIDSQYREDRSSLSTDFTFNLSDSLKDVVSLKLYSVQIPYTWYTIDTAFGSNFFYLKGNSAGINDGNHDIKIEIPSGNYSPADLITAVNSSINSAAKTTYPDINFATTAFSYNSSNSLAMATIDISNQFNETAYYLKFNSTNSVPLPTNVNANRLNNIASFLGFDICHNPQTMNAINQNNPTTPTTSDVNKYYPYKIKSQQFNYNSAEIVTNTIYKLTAANNYFTVYQYRGGDGTSGFISPICDFSFNIILSSLPVNIFYNGQTIYNELINQITSCPYLDSKYSYIKLFSSNTSTATTAITYYEMSLKLNRNTTSNLPNSKMAVVFPTETTTTQVWCGSTSLFEFETTVVEMNNIISEYSPLAETDVLYSISTYPYIKLHCSKYGYDCSVNDLTFQIPNRASVPYSRNEYLAALNTAITDELTTYPISDSDNYVINGAVDVSSKKFKLDVDINRVVTQEFLTLDISGELTPIFDDNSYNLSNTTPSGSKNQKTTYTFYTNKPVAYIRATNPNNIISGDLSFAIYPINTASTDIKFSLNYNDLGTNIANWFTQKTDSENTAIFKGTTCTIRDRPDDTQKFDISLNVVYNKVLNQNDYTIQFFDVSKVDQTNFIAGISGYITDFSNSPIAVKKNPYSKNQVGLLNELGLNAKYEISYEPSIYYSTTFGTSFSSAKAVIDTSYLAYLVFDNSNYLIRSPNAFSKLADNYYIIPGLLQLVVTQPRPSQPTQTMDCSLTVILNGDDKPHTLQMYLTGYVNVPTDNYIYTDKNEQIIDCNQSKINYIPPTPAPSPTPPATNQIGVLNNTLNLSSSYAIQYSHTDISKNYIYASTFASTATTINTDYMAYVVFDASNYLIESPLTFNEISNKYVIVPETFELAIVLAPNASTATITDCSFIVSVVDAKQDHTIKIYLLGYVTAPEKSVVFVNTKNQVIDCGRSKNITYTPTLNDEIKSLYPNYKIGGFFNKFFNVSGYDLNANNKLSAEYSVKRYASFFQNSGMIIDASFMVLLRQKNVDLKNSNARNYAIWSPSGNYNKNTSALRGEGVLAQFYSDFSGNFRNLINDMRVQFNSSSADVKVDISNVVFSSSSGNEPYAGGVDYPYINCTVTFDITFDISQSYNLFNRYSTWETYLNVDPSMVNEPYDVSKSYISGETLTTITSISEIQFNYINITTLNNTISVIPYESGVYSARGENIFTITIPPTSTQGYSRDQLLSELNARLKSIPVLSNSRVYIETDAVTGLEYTVFSLTANKTYTAKDYNLVFYDPYSFVTCSVGDKYVRNASWNSTLGWILGFRNQTTYDLSGSSGIISVRGDTGVSTNLYNYFMICLDDYNQNRINDGLVTITGKDTGVSLPSYANASNFYCDPATGIRVYNAGETVDNNKLTQKQLYSLMELTNATLQTNAANDVTASSGNNTYTTTPYVPDVFGIVPMKVSGLSNGQVYVEFGGTLQNQERIYFGPVNVRRMTIKLLSDRGEVINLNGANWSFSLICEQIYKQNPTGK
jgi:hypothetical protein